MATRRLLRTPAPLAAVGFALAWPAALGADALAVGGLAPIAVATVIAIAIGVPLATVEWTSARGSSPVDDALRSATALWSMLLIGALAAPYAHGLGLLFAALAWLTGALAVAAGARAVPFVAGSAVVVMLGGTIGASSVAPPWTLLEASWTSWRTWLPAAIAGGILLAGAGFGQWRDMPEPAPGTRRHAWAVPGLALVAALLVAVRVGARYEAAAPDPLGPVAIALALAAAGCAVLERDGARAHPIRYAAAGFLATWWFAGPAQGALPLWWGTLVLIGPAVASAVLAVRSRGSERAVAGLACVVLAIGSAVGWPATAISPAAAATAAITVVVAVWVAGTPALVRRPA